MGTRLARADELVEQLRAAGIAATRDVGAALALAPCVLIPPPRLDWTDASVTWRLVALAASPLGGEQSWTELDDLVDAVSAELPIELAEPSAYQLPDGSTAPRPAYLLTLTESE